MVWHVLHLPGLEPFSVGFAERIPFWLVALAVSTRALSLQWNLREQLKAVFNICWRDFLPF